MAQKKITRKELLKDDDEFVSITNRVAQYIVAHGKQIKYVGYGVFIVLVIVVGIGLFYRHLNQKALAAYNSAYKILVSDTSAEPSKETFKRSGEELEALIDEYGWTKMATLAMPQLASINFGQGKYDEAISLYHAYLEKEDSGSIYHFMAYFGLAAAYEAKGDHQSAINNLKEIVESENNFLQEEAMFSLGRVYALSGQQETARKIFGDFVSRFADSPLLPLAKANLH